MSRSHKGERHRAGMPKATAKSIAAQLGAMGGRARAKALSGKQRKEIARKAARARWKMASILK